MEKKNESALERVKKELALQTSEMERTEAAQDRKSVV